MPNTPRKRKSERPRIEIPRSRLDTGLEAAAVVVLLALWTYTALTYSSLPGTIPMHFDLAGNIDGTGSRGVVWLLPTISSTVYVLLALVSRAPHTFNYLRPITPENARRQYTLALRMMRTLKLGVVALMLLIQVIIVLIALGTIAQPSFWIIAGPIVLVLLPVAFYLVQAVREK